MKIKDFFNKVLNSDKIYYAEEIGGMTPDEFRQNEPAIDFQLNNLGIPREADLAGSDEVYVRSYTRSDGTKVRAYYRSRPGHGSDGFLTGAASAMNDSGNPALTGGVSVDNYIQPASSVPWQSSVASMQELEDLLSKMTIGEMLINMAGCAASVMAPIAGSNLQNAMQDFKYAKKNEHAYVFQSRDGINSKNLNNLMDKVGIPKKSRGVVYDNNSEQSKKLWKSPEIQQYVYKNYSKLLMNKQNLVEDIEFKKRGFWDDNYFGIQNCKLYNPHITPDGYFSGVLVDYYDFKYRPGNDKATQINNWGYSMQEKGFLENYFNIYIIHEKL